MTRLAVLWPTLILAGTILTVATVLVGDSAGYGFPLAWKTGGCPPPGLAVSVSCLRAVVYDWPSFGVDFLLYTFVGYGLVLNYSKCLVTRRLL